MPNMAKIDLIGHLGRDAELKTVGGTTVCEFSIAVSTKKKGVETTNWFRCALWGKRGESLVQYLTKGKAVFVTGRFEARDFVKQDGVAGYSLECNVGELEFLGKASDGGGEQASSEQAPPVDDDDIPF